MKLLNQLIKNKLVQPPPWLPDNILYANIHGSELYGCATDTSDKDIYGICMPPLKYLFPHVDGYINGFGNPPTFESWMEHHIKFGEKSYDFQIFNIVKFLWLAIEGNPNVLECLFAPQDCILHKSVHIQPIVDMRVDLLTQKIIPRFRGYAISQLHKMKEKAPVGKRKDNYDKYGFCPKFASHTIRLLGYAEQILRDRDIDLRRDREILKAIKRGDWSLAQIEECAQEKILNLDKLIRDTTLPTKPNMESVKNALINVIESHYGSLDSYIKKSYSDAEMIVAEIRELVKSTTQI